MKIIGHRGARGHEPENTLLSIQKSIELQADMTEIDVYVLRSGEVVVIHDHRVDRTTEGNGRVQDHTLAELKSLNVGKGQSVPTLTEVLDLINGSIGLNIELKGPYTALPVARILDEYIDGVKWTPEHFMVSSFDHHELRRFKHQSPYIPIAVLEHTVPITYASIPQELMAAAIVPNFEFLTREYVDDAHSRGLKVYPFTVNHEDDLRDMQRLGVDGVISDYPDRARAVLMGPQVSPQFRQRLSTYG